MVLLAGAEVIASTRAALKAQVRPDWSEEVEGDLEDEGLGLDGLVSFEAVRHGLADAPAAYALCEIARRARRGVGDADYSRQMAELLAPFAETAGGNPYAMFHEVRTAKQIAEPVAGNGYIAYPYTRAMVAKDGVNQAAAVLLTTVAKARELGIGEDKWIFLHAYADADDRPLLRRPDLSRSPALQAVTKRTLELGDLRGGELDYIDTYSCFPIVVLETMAALGLEPGDSGPMQRVLDEVPDVALKKLPDGDGVIEAYTVQFRQGLPVDAVVVGRLSANGKRFVANNFEGDTALIERLLDRDMVGQPIAVAGFGKHNRLNRRWDGHRWEVAKGKNWPVIGSSNARAKLAA